jgi:hypothetical protein
MLILFADRSWPDAFDAAVTLTFLGSVLGTVVLGYLFMVLDYRAYLRSLHRTLVKVVQYIPELPAWAHLETPRSIAALGLRMPCTELDLMRAYRAQVKNLHPDHGGDKRRFLMLQQNFEEALEYLAEYDRTATPVHRRAA